MNKISLYYCNNCDKYRMESKCTSVKCDAPLKKIMQSSFFMAFLEEDLKIILTRP